MTDKEETHSEEESSSGKGKKVLVIAILLLFLVLGAVGFVAYQKKWISLDFIKSGKDSHKKTEEYIFYDLPDILVNIGGGNLKQGFLKVSLTLELLDKTDIPKIEKMKSKILDQLNIYLRSIQYDDLRGGCDISGRGCGSLMVLREEIFSRISSIVAPIKIQDVLFREILVQ